jgi:Putative lumazine-binding
VTTADEDAVVRTVLDYFEGWFDGDAARMKRALHPGLAKRSLETNDSLNHLTADVMVEATARGRGKRWDPGKREIDVRVVDLHGEIASVVVHSNVYREYLHLVRTPDGWRIVNALWRFA